MRISRGVWRLSITLIALWIFVIAASAYLGKDGWLLTPIKEICTAERYSIPVLGNIFDCFDRPAPIDARASGLALIAVLPPALLLGLGFLGRWIWRGFVVDNV